MTNLRRAAQQALEALEGFDHFRRIMTDGPDESDKVFAEDHAEVAFVTAARVIPALRAALAEPEQEPVAWIQKTAVDWLTTTSSSAYIITPVMKNTNDEAYVPLYTAPTPRKPRKPLTDKEIQTIWAKTFEMGSSANTFARAIERAHGIGEQHE